MKILSIIFSLVLLSILVNDYVNSIDTTKKTSNEASSNSVFNIKQLPKELSAAEQAWSMKKKERLSDISPKEVEEEQLNDQKMLTLGDKKYTLYGIFTGIIEPFILLKDEAGNLTRLAKGEELNEQATLVSIKSNKISFQYNSKSIEFKLFERKE